MNIQGMKLPTGENSGNCVDPKLIMQMFANGVKIPLADVTQLLAKVSLFFANEPNLLYLDDPVCVVGDLHGQLGDLYKVLELGGSLDSMKFLFMGDYVDRGPQGVEILIILFSLKIRFPNKIFLMRGNHESRNATDMYGFRAECLNKFNVDFWIQVMAIFDQMPLAAVINGNFFAVHGGISKELLKATDLNRIKRNVEPPVQGMLTDLLWSDPADERETRQWVPNNRRGCSSFFGPEETFHFLRTNNLNIILRAHECVNNGFDYKTFGSNMPVVLTIFSAEDYCGIKNLGAIMQIKNNSMNMIQFDFGIKSREVLFQEYGGIFEWTMPFIDHFLQEIVAGFSEFTNDALENPKYKSITELDPKALAELKMTPDMVKNLKMSLTSTEQEIERRKTTVRLSQVINSESIARSSLTYTPKINDTLISLSENNTDFFGEFIERRRSDFFLKNVDKAHVNEDPVFSKSAPLPGSVNQPTASGGSSAVGSAPAKKLVSAPNSAPPVPAPAKVSAPSSVPAPQPPTVAKKPGPPSK